MSFIYGIRSHGPCLGAGAGGLKLEYCKNWMYCCVTFTTSPYLDINLSYSIHTSYTLGSMTSDPWWGSGGGARGQNLELPEIFSSFYFEIDTTVT